MKFPRFAAPLLVVFTAACASWHWSSHGEQPATAAPRSLEADERLHPAPTWGTSEEDAAAQRASTVPATAHAVVPQTPKERYRTALFYSDLGPDAVDVSVYPTQQRYNYGIYARTCSRCHTLARSINAPLVGRGWWEFYVLGMRVRSRWQEEPLSKDKVKAVLDFLEYDSRVRKVENVRDFDRLTEELKRRFDASIAERISAMQKANPRPLPPLSH